MILAGPYLVQGLLAELLVSDNPSSLALEKLCLSSLLDGMLAQPHLQVGHVIPAHVRDAVGRGDRPVLTEEGGAALVEEGGWGGW